MPLDEVALLPQESVRSAFPKRYERSLRFRFKEDMLRCLGGAALLRGVLGAGEDDIVCGKFGKPYLKKGDLFFSISHSGEYVVLAVDDREIGADIEQIDSRHLSLAPHVFTADELVWYRSREEERFYVLWTLKESVIKQLGVGLQMTPQSFSVLPLTRGEGIDAGLRRLYGSTAICNGHCISVCTEHPAGNLTPRILRAPGLSL